jgi:inorganic pyrophosphatase
VEAIAFSIDQVLWMWEVAHSAMLVEMSVYRHHRRRTREEEKAERNDRIVAVEQDNHSYAHMKHIKDLGKEFVEELEEFFVNYHELSGKKYRIMDVKGPAEAQRRMKDGLRAARRSK